MEPVPAPLAVLDHRPRWQSAQTVLLLVVLTAIALFVRCRGAGRGLWLDELTTAWVIRDGMGQVPARAWLNNLSPVYYGIIACSARLVRYDELGLRLPSLLAGALLIPSLFFISFRITRSGAAAAVVAALAALDEYLVTYSLEVRPYALVQLAGVWQAYAFVRLFEGKALVAVAVGALSALVFHLHYLAALFLFLPEVVFVAAAAVLARRVTWGAAVPFLVAAAVAVVLALPALPHFLHLLRVRHVLGFAAGRTGWHAVLRFDPHRYLLAPMVCAWLLGLALGRYGKVAAHPKLPSGARVWACFLVCWFLTPSLAAWLLDKAALVQANQDRYLLASSPAVLLAVGTVLCWWQHRAQRWAFVLAIMVLVHFSGKQVLMSYVTGSFPAYAAREDWRAAVGYFNAHWGGGITPVFVQSDLVEARWLGEGDDALLREYLLAPATTVYPAMAPADQLHPLGLVPDRFSAEDVKCIRQSGEAWVLSRVVETAPKLQAELLRELRLKDVAYEVAEMFEARGVLVLHLRRPGGKEQQAAGGTAGQ